MRFALLADCHLGHPECQFEAVVEAIVTYGRDLDGVAIIGDFLDGPYPAAEAALEEFCQQVPSEVLAKIGIVVGNHEESGILAQDERFFVADAVNLHFRQYNVVGIHGHDVGMERLAIAGRSWGTTAGIALKRHLMENSGQFPWMPGISENTFLVHGHGHVAYLNRKERVGCPGTWKGDPKENSNVGWIIILNDDEIQLTRL